CSHVRGELRQVPVQVRGLPLVFTPARGVSPTDDEFVVVVQCAHAWMGSFSSWSAATGRTLSSRTLTSASTQPVVASPTATQPGAIYPKPLAITSPPKAAPIELPTLNEAWFRAAPSSSALPAILMIRDC